MLIFLLKRQHHPCSGPTGLGPREWRSLSHGFPDAAAHREFLGSPATTTHRVGSGIWSSSWRGPILNPESVRGLAVFVLNFDHWDAGDGRGPAGTFPFTPLPRGLQAASPGSLSREVPCMQLMHLPHGLRLPWSLLWSSIQHCHAPL